MLIDGWLLDILACPKCHAPLRADEQASELVCTSTQCGLAYPVRDDIPVLLIEEARPPGPDHASAQPGSGQPGSGQPGSGQPGSGQPGSGQPGEEG